MQIDGIHMLRLQRDHDYEGKPKGYRRTIHVCKEGPELGANTRQVLFSGDVIGHAASHEVSFYQPDGTPAFSIKPHRKIMPMQWPIVASDGSALGVLDQKVVAKGFWAGLDPAGSELFRVIDPQSRKDQIAMQIFGGAVSKYAFVRGEELLGSVSEEPREEIEASGIRGFFKRFRTQSDPVLRFQPGITLPDLRLLALTVFLLYEITVPLDRST